MSSGKTELIILREKYTQVTFISGICKKEFLEKFPSSPFSSFPLSANIQKQQRRVIFYPLWIQHGIKVGTACICAQGTA